MNENIEAIIDLGQGKAGGARQGRAGKAWHGQARPGRAWRGGAGPGRAWLGMAWQGRQGKAGPGKAGQGKAGQARLITKKRREIQWKFRNQKYRQWKYI